MITIKNSFINPKIFLADCFPGGWARGEGKDDCRFEERMDLAFLMDRNVLKHSKILSKIQNNACLCTDLLTN